MTAVQTLIGTSPAVAEMNLRSTHYFVRHDVQPGAWYRVLLPAQAEVKMSPFPPVRYMTIIELGGQSFAELPKGQAVVADVDIRGRGLLRRYLSFLARRVFESPFAAPFPLGDFERRVQNALVASRDDYCFDTVQSIREGVRTYAAGGGFTPEYLLNTRHSIEKMRADYGLDVHLPAIFTIVADVIETIRADAPAAGLSLEQCNSLYRTIVIAFLDERDCLDGLGARIASIAAKQGLRESIDRLLDRYRDAVSSARDQALACSDHEAMLKVVFDAMPTVVAADNLAKMLKELTGERKYENIMKQTDEERVRFSLAFSIRLKKLIFPDDKNHQQMLTSAKSRGSQTLDHLIQFWRGSFTYPDAILERMKSTGI